MSRERLLASRWCYRDKNCGRGVLKAKCRCCAGGHADPDLHKVKRTAGDDDEQVPIVVRFYKDGGDNQLKYSRARQMTLHEHARLDGGGGTSWLVQVRLAERREKALQHMRLGAYTDFKM